MANIKNVKHFISAPTAQALHRRMFELQMQNGKKYEFTDISFANGKWYAWYIDEVRIRLLG